MSCWRSFLGLVTPVDLLWSRRKRIQEGRSPAERWADVWRVWVGNFSGALGFIFCGVKHLCRHRCSGLEPARRRFSERARNQKSLPRRGRKPEGLLVRARGTYIAETPEACLWGFCYIGSPDWTRTSNPSINSRMLCQLSYGGLFCFRCWFPLQRVITIPGLFGLRNLKCREVHHSLG